MAALSTFPEVPENVVQHVVITVDVAALECRRVRSRYVTASWRRALFLGIADERLQVVADDHLHGGSCQ
jgi:hypothetical protein